MKDGAFTADRLLALYDRVAEAEDAIPRLRRFVLDLAVRGKLVEQDPTDEPAAELLKRIAKEKARLVKAGEIKLARHEPPDFNVTPNELPNSWTWAAFGDVQELVRGVTYSKSDVGDGPSDGFVPILRANNIGAVLTHDDPVFVKRACVSDQQFLRAGDFMIALSSGSKNLVGKAAFVPQDFQEGFGGFCGVIRLINNDLQGFVRVFLQSDMYRDSIAAGSRGIGINNLKKETLSNLFFPLPPLAEQQRIVAKVDELMALCDRLQAARVGREAVRDRLTATTLTRLTAPEADAETFPTPSFQTNARFALQTLPTLTTRPDQIKTLRQAILNLAVQGKLVEQDAADEPAAELVRKIGHISDSSPVHPEAELPIGWVWAKIDQLATVGTGVTPSKSEPAYHVGGTIPWVNSAATNLPVIHAVETFVTERAVKECRLKLYPAGSLVVALYGQGKTRGQAAELRIAATVNQACAVIQFSNGFESIRPFLHLSLKKQYEEMRSLAEGGAQPNLNLGKIKSKALPLPPLAEQHRIVARVDALMALCDQLEASLTTATTTRSRLLESLLHEALNGALGGLPAAAA